MCPSSSQGGVMLDHVSLSVPDPKRSQTFYAKALAPLGYKLISPGETSFGIGLDGGSTVWVSKGAAQKPIAHLAFRAKDRKQVQEFHKAALAAGGRDNGKGAAHRLRAELLRGFRLRPRRQQRRGGLLQRLIASGEGA